jgi:hypothetical protein
MMAYTQAMMSGGDAVCNVVLMSGRSSLCP